MITFGFKTKYGGLLRAVFSIGIGLLMVILPQTSLFIVVKFIAAFLIASGIVSLIVGIRNRINGNLPLMAFNAVVDMVLGILLFMYPGFAVDFLMVIIGAGLLLLGIFQLAALFSARNFVVVGPFGYILPVLTAVGGLVILLKPFGIASAITVIAGIALVVYGISELFASWKMRKAMQEYEVKFEKKHSDFENAKDVEFHKVDDND